MMVRMGHSLRLQSPETSITRQPIFVPSVGHFRQGMLVSVPLHLDSLPAKQTGGDLHAALADAYGGCEYVGVVEPAVGGRLEAQALNRTNRIELYIQANEKQRQAVLLAQFDNLRKGASGAAVQNLELMLGLNGASAR